MIKNMKQGLLPKVGALVLTIAMAIAYVLFGAAEASAQALAVPEAAKVTITKLKQPGEVGEHATGVPTGTWGQSDGIEDVTFTLELVEGTGVDGANDIGTNEGQKYASSLTLDTDSAEYSIDESTDPIVMTTGNGGIVERTVPRGLYLVTESMANPISGVTLGQPFFLAVPLTDPDNRDNWLTEIFVYPKNSQVTATKSANDADARAAASENNKVTWTVLADIPRLAPETDNPLTGFVITDELDPRLDYDGAAVKLTGSPEVTLADGDYTLTPQSGITETQRIVTLEFTESGLVKLQDAWQKDATSQVELTINTTVNAKALNDSAETEAISNNAEITVNNNPETKVTTEDAETYVGGIKIKKEDSVSEDPLKDAVFQVYATDPTLPEDPEAPQPQPLTIGGQDEWTTDDGGVVVIPGLFSSYHQNGVATDDSVRKYWVVEIKAPDGYQLLAEPLPVEVKKMGQTTEIKIQNAPTAGGGFELPLTGGSGTALLTIAGISILGVVLFAARRRAAAE